jgi:hypothetical protein
MSMDRSRLRDGESPWFKPWTAEQLFQAVSLIHIDGSVPHFYGLLSGFGESWPIAYS